MAKKPNRKAGKSKKAGKHLASLFKKADLAARVTALEEVVKIMLKDVETLKKTSTLKDVGCLECWRTGFIGRCPHQPIKADMGGLKELGEAVAKIADDMKTKI